MLAITLNDGVIIMESLDLKIFREVAKAGSISKAAENMSYVQCPDCGKKIFVFGKSHLQDVADKYDLKILGQLPLDSELTQLSDMGMIENYSSDWLDEFEEKVKNF